VPSSLSQVQKNIWTRIHTLWEARTPIGWPNVDFTPPETAPWIEVAIAWGDGEAVTMGPTNRSTLTGVLFINCFSVEGEGQGELMGTADAARDLVNRIEVSGIRFGVPSAPQPVEGIFSQVVVRIPFTVDETV